MLNRKYSTVRVDNKLTLSTAANLTAASTNGTSAAGAITTSGGSGRVTTEALTTAGLAAFTLTITNPLIKAADKVFVSMGRGTSAAGTAVVGTVKPADGSVVIIIQNVHASVALNGTLVIDYFVVKAA